MHEVKAHVTDLKKLEETLIDWVEAEVGRGKECINAAELGEVIDMIKDLADARKNCFKAKYYESIVEAMEEAEDHEEIISRMGYNTHRSPVTGRYVSTHGGSHMRGRMGYYDDWYRELDYDDPHHRTMTMAPSRHYTESHEHGMHKMHHEPTEESVTDVISSVKEMWKEADPDLKKKMKANFSTLLTEMNI